MSLLSNRVTALEAKTKDLDGRVAVLETKTKDLDGRVGKLEAVTPPPPPPPPPDTTPPKITAPGPMTVATLPGGTNTIVVYPLPITDDPAATVVCQPPSGATFPVGVTNVIITARDVAGNASTGSFTITVTATPAPPPVVGTEPTRTTTGPRTALAPMNGNDLFALPDGSTVVGKKISGTTDGDGYAGRVSFYGTKWRRRTLHFVDCSFDSVAWRQLDQWGTNEQVPLSEMLTLTFDHCEMAGGFFSDTAAKVTMKACRILNYSQILIKSPWSPFQVGPFPLTITDSYFWNAYTVQPSHTECFHIADYPSGVTISNCSFNQQGGSITNSGVTGIINTLGSGMLWNHCWFRSDGQPGYYSAIYMYSGAGNGTTLNHFTDCFFDTRAGIVAGLKSTDGYVHAVYTNSHDLSGNPIDVVGTYY